MYFEYGDASDEYILTKVGSIETLNDIVRVTAAAEYEISDFFSYIDIDTSRFAEPPITTMAFDDEKGDEGIDKTFSYSVEKIFEDKNYKIGFEGNASLTVHLKFQYDFHLFGEDSYVFEYWNEVRLEAATEISVFTSISLEPLELLKKDIPIFVGLDISVSLSIDFNISAKMTVTGSLTITMKSGAKKISGSPTERIDNKPKVELKIQATGKIEIEIKPILTVGFKILKVFNVNLTIEDGFPIEVTFFVPEISSEENYDADSIHTCSLCADGTIKSHIKVGMEVSFGINEKNKISIIEINFADIEKELCDFYVSLDSDGLKFGTGTCPNIQYRIVYHVTDQNGNPISGVQFGDKVTDGNGQIKMYLSPGMHQYDLNSNVYEMKDVYSNDYYVEEATDIDIILIKKEGATDPGQPGESGDDQDDEDMPNTSGVLDSGDCGAEGDNVKWTLYNDGELVIKGTGKMEDWERGYYSSEKVAPWRSSWDDKNAIKKVIIKNGVVNIGNYAFYNCYNLLEVEMAESIMEIGECAFAECGQLIEIELPKKMTEIKAGTFWRCYSLKEIIIPDYVTKVGSAFGECVALESVQLPDSVVEIRNGAFVECKNLKNIELPKGIKTIEAIFRKSGLEKITIPDGVTTIESYAFSECRNLESIQLPESITEIGEYAFEDCNLLSEIEIPKKVKEIRYHTFDNCGLRKIVIPDGVTKIEAYAFIKCRNLEDIQLPESIIEIGDSAFRECDSLESMRISNSVTTIGEYAFYSCENMASLQLSNSLTKIGEGTFSDCISLREIEIPNQVTEINGFGGCIKLESVQLPDSLKEIGGYAFSACISLREIEIPNQVTVISNGAFYGCESLESVQLPDSLTKIGDRAFCDCCALNTIYYSGSSAEWNDIDISCVDNDPLFNATIIYNYNPSSAASIALPRSTALAPVLNSTEAISSGNGRSETLTSAVVGDSYIMLIVKDQDVGDLLASDNLLYIDQKTADSETLTFDFNLTEDYSDYAVIFKEARLNQENNNCQNISGSISASSQFSDAVTLCLLNGSKEINRITTTDSTYEFMFVSAGIYTLEVGKPNHVTRTYEVTVKDEDIVQNVEIHLLGDLDGNGKINTIDVNRAYAHVRGTNPLTGYELKCANVAGTEPTVNTVDVNRIYAHVKGINLLWGSVK